MLTLISTEGINPAQLRCCDLRMKRVLSLDRWLHIDVVAQNQHVRSSVGWGGDCQRAGG